LVDRLTWRSSIGMPASRAAMWLASEQAKGAK
jgi:hypothetical protein